MSNEDDAVIGELDPICPSASRAPECAPCGGLPLGRYLYTDGREVDLCPTCDAPHVGELAPVVSVDDAQSIRLSALYLTEAIHRAHGISGDAFANGAGMGTRGYPWDLLYSAHSSARQQMHAEDVRIGNRAVRALHMALCDAVRSYCRTVLERRLGELLDAARRDGLADGLTASTTARDRPRREVGWEPSDGT